MEPDNNNIINMKAMTNNFFVFIFYPLQHFSSSASFSCRYGCNRTGVFFYGFVIFIT